MDVLVDPANLIPEVNYRIRTKHSAFGTDHIGTFVEFKNVNVPGFQKRYITSDATYPLQWYNFYETYNNVQKNRNLQSVIEKGTGALIPSSARLGGKRKSRKKTRRIR